MGGKREETSGTVPAAAFDGASHTIMATLPVVLWLAPADDPRAAALAAGGAAVPGAAPAGSLLLCHPRSPADVAAVGELLEDGDALSSARAGAEQARRELTWDASAARHLELYRELA